MKKTLPVILVAIMTIIPFCYLYYIYPSLPASVPTHFGLDGEPNGFSPKEYIFWIMLSVSLVSVGSFVLVRNLSKIDPKKSAALASGKTQLIALAVVALLSAIMILIPYSAVQGRLTFSRLFNPLMGIFFIVVGNLMYNIKPNYFVGIRIPWTLENADNWRATHHLAGKLWVIGGIFITVCTLILPVKTGEYFFMGITLLLVIVPIAYSFLYFKKHQVPV